MDTGLKGRTVVITGGSTGIGEAIAHAFAREGCTVSICARRRDHILSAIERAGKLGLTITGNVCDVTDAAALTDFIDSVGNRNGGIDILVNNAGRGGVFRSILDYSEKEWDETFNTNVKAALAGTRAVVPHMKRKNGGSVVNISSFASVIPTLGEGEYGISKAALNALTVILAGELAPQGIRVNGVIPGKIVTPMAEATITPKSMESLLRPLAIRRLGMPEDIASLVVFLCSEQAGYITGQNYRADGGKYIVQNPWFSLQS